MMARLRLWKVSVMPAGVAMPPRVVVRSGPLAAYCTVSVPSSSIRVAVFGARTHCARTSTVRPRMSVLARPCQAPSQARRHSGGLKLPRTVSAAVSSNGSGLSSTSPPIQSGAHGAARLCMATRPGGKS